MSTGISTERQRAYLEILKWGLIAVRHSAVSGKQTLCEIEADHLHNIPTLLEESNELRHRYYIEQERGLYLDRLCQLDDEDYSASFTTKYASAWQVLIELTDAAG